MPLVGRIGDNQTQLCLVHGAGQKCTGACTVPWSQSNQNFVKINGEPILVVGSSMSMCDGCGVTLEDHPSIVKINGVRVSRDGDPAVGPHPQKPLEVVTQNFIRAD